MPLSWLRPADRIGKPASPKSLAALTPPGEADWQLYIGSPPLDRTALIETWHHSQGNETCFIRANQLSPWHNVADLYWRYA